MNMNKISDEITELVGRLIYYKDEAAKGGDWNKINTDKWVDKYHGDTAGTAVHYMQSLEFNSFRAEVQSVTSQVMRVVQKNI